MGSRRSWHANLFNPLLGYATTPHCSRAHKLVVSFRYSLKQHWLALDLYGQLN